MQGKKHVIINTNSSRYKKWLLEISITELAENGSSHFILRKFLHGNYHGRDFKITFLFLYSFIYIYVCEPRNSFSNSASTHLQGVLVVNLSIICTLWFTEAKLDLGS